MATYLQNNEKIKYIETVNMIKKTFKYDSEKSFSTDLDLE